MQEIIWEVQYTSLPSVIRYCKRCKKEIEYLCSGFFRINAQRKYLDVWLIYKCTGCNTTWNATIYSRINPQSIQPKVLEGFHVNDNTLVEQYAMNTQLLHKNGVKIKAPTYNIVGNESILNTQILLHIKTQYPSRLKVSTIIREKLCLSQRTFERLVTSGKIRSLDGHDLLKCRLNSTVHLIIDHI